MEIFNREAFVNVIIELFEVDIKKFFLREEFSKQFLEPFLVLVHNHMHNFGSIVDYIQLGGEVLFFSLIFSDVLLQQLLCAHTDF